MDYTVNSDNFYIIDDDLYLTNSANYDDINLYEIIINHEIVWKYYQK